MNRKQLIYLAGGAIAMLAAVTVFLLQRPGDSGDLRSAGEGPGLADLSFLDERVQNLELSDSDRAMLEDVNPLTGENYNEEQIRRIVYLRARFPLNSLIPRARTPEEESERTAREEKLRQDLADISAGEATEAQVREYYEQQESTVRDRLELIRFVLDEGVWPSEVSEQYRAMLSYNELLTERIAERKTRSLELLASRATYAQR